MIELSLTPTKNVTKWWYIFGIDQDLLRLDALKANFLYSEVVKKTTLIICSSLLNVFLIYQYHYLPNKKIY